MLLSALRRRFLQAIALSIGAMCAAGCTLGFRVYHEYPQAPASARQATILVKQFSDMRVQSNKQYIGRSISSIVVVPIAYTNWTTKGEETVPGLITGFCAEALNKAGYTAIVEDQQSPQAAAQSNVDGILTGEVTKFWLGSFSFVAWHTIGVKLRLLDPTGQSVLWERELEESKADVLWLVGLLEAEELVSRSITAFLNKVVAASASDEFYGLLKK